MARFGKLALILSAIVAIIGIFGFSAFNTAEAGGAPRIIQEVYWNWTPNQIRFAMSSNIDLIAQVTNLTVGNPPTENHLNLVANQPAIWYASSTPAVDMPVGFITKAGNLTLSTQWFSAGCPKGPAFTFGPLGIVATNTTGEQVFVLDVVTGSRYVLEKQHEQQINGQQVNLVVTTKNEALGTDNVCANATYKREGDALPPSPTATPTPTATATSTPTPVVSASLRAKNPIWPREGWQIVYLDIHSTMPISFKYNVETTCGISTSASAPMAGYPSNKTDVRNAYSVYVLGTAKKGQCSFILRGGLDGGTPLPYARADVTIK